MKWRASIDGLILRGLTVRAPYDSAQNEAERPNAAIGETLVDSGAVKWEYYKATDGLNQEQIKRLSVGDLKKLEEDNAT